MKKQIILFSLFFTLTFASKAQLNNFDVGDSVPDFNITDLNGVNHSLYQYTDAGKYVLLDIFGYWCGTCRAKARTIDGFYSKYGCNNYDVVVLGIEGEGTNLQLLLFDSLAGISVNSYPSASGLEGNGAIVHSLFGISAYPTLVIIDPNRKIINENITTSTSILEIFSAFPSNSINAYECNTSLIENKENQRFTIGPSPCFRNLKISTDESLTNSSFYIKNVIGQVVYEGKINKTVSEIDLSSLVNGLYILSFNNFTSQKFKFLKVN